MELDLLLNLKIILDPSQDFLNAKSKLILTYFYALLWWRFLTYIENVRNEWISNQNAKFSYFFFLRSTKDNIMLIIINQN